MIESDSALTRLFPRLGSLARVRLGSFPTPIEEIDISAAVPSFRGRAWLKREDLSAPVIGGNKVRKLEYTIGEALTRGKRTLVTTGGLGSNHCLATAYHGRAVGLDTHAVLFPHPLTEASRHRFRAICALASGLSYSPLPNVVTAVAAAARARLALANLRPYFIPPGGSSATGVIGFANAGLELAEQAGAGLCEPPDIVFTAYGSGGTAAGLALGLQLGGLTSDVVAVRVYPLPLTSTVWVRTLAVRAHRRLREVAGGTVPPFESSRITAPGAYLGRGYAHPTSAGDAAREVARDLGFTLEPTYTAKAFAAFLDTAASEAGRNRNLVFVLTYDPRLPEGLADGLRPERVPPRLRRYL